MADIASAVNFGFRRPATPVWKPTWCMWMDGGRRTRRRWRGADSGNRDPVPTGDHESIYDLFRAFLPILLVLSSFCIHSAFLSGMAGLLLCKEFAISVIWVVVFGSSSVNFCCSHKHWPNLILLPPVQYQTTEAELFYLHHLCSSAASARGSRSTSSSGTTKVYLVSAFSSSSSAAC